MTRGTDRLAPLIAEFERLHRQRNGVPDDDERADRTVCLATLRTVLNGRVADPGIVPSPLGVEWTEVFDVHLMPGTDLAPLTARGWLPVDQLVDGPPGGTASRWAVVEDGRVLGGLRLLDDPVDAVARVLGRCREQSEVGLRDVLELCLLREQGLPFPVDDVVLRAAADVESALGGRALAPWATGRSAAPPVRLRGGRRTAVIAVSGVDGSGKSTLLSSLTESLHRAGIQVSTVWVRPGMGLGPLNRLAAWVKNVLHQDPRPGLRAMAAPELDRPLSRRGPVGWIWAMLVTVSFLVGVRRQHAAATGVVLYDRHLLDALATLDFAYDGVDLRLPRLLLRRLLPKADISLYLDVSAEVAVTRKPDDLLGEQAVRRQLERYAHWLDRLPPVVRLDATLSTSELLRCVLQAVTAIRTDPQRPAER